MEAILPFKIKNEQKFFESALKVGFDEMEIYKFIYMMQLSDLDIFPKMHDERINMLIYSWEICEDYKQNINPNEWELPEELEIILKLLVPWTMDIWFSKEWDKCKYLLKSALIHCLNRARDLLMRMPDMMQINWDFLLLYNLKPWSVLYLKNLTVTKEKTLANGAQSIETEESPATDEDISYVKLEQLPIIVLRLVKLFDQSSIDMVKTLCMRVIAAWNKMHQTELETSSSRRPYIPPEDKKCLMLICHIYLMAVYESDDVKGYVIDNMINNIRFYYQGFQNSAPFHVMDNLEYTPARYIALTNIHLRVQKRDFFDFFIWNKYDTALVNLFGVVSQAYKSYLLGNLLMELNNMNEDDFASNIPLYKRLMNSYVNEREKSELFLISDLNKIEAQRYAHNIIQTVKNVTDHKSKICKGNRMSNIGNYENSDDIVTPLADPKSENDNSEDKECEIKKDDAGEEMEDEEERVRIKESELRLDPIFQNLPNNESMLYYVYEVLAKKNYKGWHFAKVVLLMKIIGREQNMIETWRYHPGLTTDFMLNLETKLSRHYVDLAKIFGDHLFLEQEFWLTAFYLNPTSDIYENIKRLGMRNNRKRTDEQTKLIMNIDNIEAKYGLLSSTIDVKELASMSNTDDPATDYEPLFSALHSLRVPDSLVKDMLTAIFLPRNRSFAWSVDWVILRNRCKMIMTSSKEKKRFVDLNMAEANERLKYLIIDYEKYKNRPQLDYGTIEEGYENLMAGGEFDKESEEEEEEEEEEDFEDDEDVYESKRRGRGSLAADARKKEDEKLEEDNSQEDDPFLMGKRRTRARTAATLASFLFQTLPRSTRRKRNQKPSEEEEAKVDEDKISADNYDKSSDSKSPIMTSASPIPSLPLTASCDQKDTQITDLFTKNLKECLKERPIYLNTTQGFQDLIDIWNVEKSDLQLIDGNCVSLLESSVALQIAVKLKLLNKEINPMSCDEKECIDDTEMIIHNADFAIKRECDLNAINLDVLTKASFGDTTIAMDAENNKENVKTDIIGVTYIEDNVENAEARDLQSDEKVMEYAKIKTDDIQDLPTADENSSDTTNSDMSTVAHKDSGEVSEANTEINSKRNSVNLDIETDYKLIHNNQLNEQREIGTSPAENEKEKIGMKCQKNKEISQEIAKYQNKSSNKNDDGIEEKNNAQGPSKKLPEEPKETDDENELVETKTLQINDKDVSSNSKELIADETLHEQSHICDRFVNLKDFEEKSSDIITNNSGDLQITDKESKNPEKSNESKELMHQKDQYLQEETNSNKTYKYDIKLLNLRNKDIEVQNETNDLDDMKNLAKNACSQSEERETSIKTLVEFAETSTVPVNLIQLENSNSSLVPVDLNKTNNSSQEFTAHNSEIHLMKCKLASSKSTTSYDTGTLSQTNETVNQEIFPTSDCKRTVQALTIRTELETFDGEKESHIAIAFSDDTHADSTKAIEEQESSDDEISNLKQLCLTKNLKVLLRKLGPADLISLRQPKVKLCRISYEKYALEFRAKRRCIKGKDYIEFYDSSNSNNSHSNNTSSSEVYCPTRVKRKIPVRRHSIRQLRTSESENDSNNSEDCKLSTIIAKARKRRLSTPSTSQSSTTPHVTGPKSARKTGPKSARHTAGPKSAKQNLVVTPRSASGLKLRISNAEQDFCETGVPHKKTRPVVVYDEIIQLSSSSSYSSVLNDLSVIEEEVIEIDDNPLFEEEIII